MSEDVLSPDVDELDGNDLPEEEGTGEQDEQEDQEETNYYTQEQVESAVKTRVNTFNKKLERMKPYEAAVKKIGEITGLSITDLVARLETMSDVEQASILGLTPEQLSQKKNATREISAASEKARALQMELEEQKLTIDPRYKDFALYKDEIYDIVEENPKLSLKQAYTLVKGDVGTKAAVRDAEQRTIAKMTKSSNQRVVKPGPTPPNTTQKIDPVIISAAKKVGMDPAEYAAYANISSLDQFETFKARKK